MSYKKFKSELAMLWQQLADAGIQKTPVEKDILLMKKWREEGRISDLVNFIKENWDSGNCDEYITDIRMHLIQEKNIEWLLKLWIAIINNRIEKLNLYSTNCKLESINLNIIRSIEHYNFDVFRKRIDKTDINYNLGFYLNGVRFGLLQLKADLHVTGFNGWDAQISDYLQDLEAFEPKRFKFLKYEEGSFINDIKPEKDNFWDVIEGIKNQAQNDTNLFMELYEMAYQSVSNDIVRAHHLKLNQLLDALFTEKLAVYLFFSTGNYSDDDFEYYSNWVISQGEAYYKSILNLDMENIPKENPAFAFWNSLEDAFVNILENRRLDSYCPREKMLISMEVKSDFNQWPDLYSNMLLEMKNLGLVFV